MFRLHIDTGGSNIVLQFRRVCSRFHSMPASNLRWVCRIVCCNILNHCSHFAHTCVSWILGHDYCCAEVSKTNDRYGWPTSITLKKWEVLPRVHDTLMPHPDGWETIPPPRVLVPPFPDVALYADSGIACELCIQAPMY